MYIYHISEGVEVVGNNKKTLSEIRDYKVVKRNDLIQKSRHQLNLQEQKIILYMISKIKPNDGDFTEQIFSISEFCQIIGLDDDNGGNYAYTKKTLKSLSDKSIWVTLDDGSETIFRWLNDVTISKRSGLIRLKHHEKLKSYLLDLHENFTQYNLIYTLAMRSQYSIRLYELLKSYQYQKYVIFDLDELKKLLFAENYKLGNDFKKRVIEPATNEICKLADIWVTYDLIKNGRKFSEVRFDIHAKDMSGRLDAWTSIQHEIGWDSVSKLTKQEKLEREKKDERPQLPDANVATVADANEPQIFPSVYEPINDAENDEDSEENEYFYKGYDIRKYNTENMTKVKFNAYQTNVKDIAELEAMGKARDYKDGWAHRRAKELGILTT